MNKEICSIILTGVLGIFSLIGILTNYFIDDKKRAKKKDMINGLLFSILAMIIILYLIPEIYNCLGFKNLYLAFIFFVIGYIIMKLVSNYFDLPKRSKRTKDDEEKVSQYIGNMLILIFVIYNVMIGIEVYSTIQKSMTEGISLIGNSIIKNIFLGFIIYYFINGEKTSKIKKISTSLLFTLTPLIGTILMILTKRTSSSAILIGSCCSLILGMMLFVLITEIIGNIKSCKDKKNAIAGIILGACLVAISCLV